jgi:hypothetical protein
MDLDFILELISLFFRSMAGFDSKIVKKEK